MAYMDTNLEMEENYFSFLKDEKYQLCEKAKLGFLSTHLQMSIGRRNVFRYSKTSTSVFHLFQLLFFFMKFSSSSLEFLEFCMKIRAE